MFAGTKAFQWSAAMNILVIGAGAMGSLFGSRFGRAGENVFLLDIHREHIAAIRRKGLTIIELDGRLETTPIEASTNASDIPWRADLVLVMVKSYATGAALASLQERHLQPSTLFLTLQNGIGNAELLAGTFEAASVLAGVTAQGATFVEPGVVRHGGNGPTHVGAWSGGTDERVYRIVRLWNKAGMEAHAASDVQTLIWKKLMVNIGINAITALTGIRNGAIDSLAPARRLSEAAVLEALAVAQAAGIPLNDFSVEDVFRIAQATAANRSSMGQDVDHRRRTEIDAINGAIVRLGEVLQVPTPVNRTLTELIHTLEAVFEEETAAASVAGR